MPYATLIHPTETEMNRLTELSSAFLDEEGVHTRTESEVRQELNHLFQDHQALVYTHQEAIHAFCLFDTRPERVQVKRIYTRPAFRNQGIASEFLNRLRHRGLPVSFFVASDNASAITFYERLGAEEEFRAFSLSPLTENR